MPIDICAQVKLCKGVTQTFLDSKHVISVSISPFSTVKPRLPVGPQKVLTFNEVLNLSGLI